mgnify:CR=1 FL=1
MANFTLDSLINMEPSVVSRDLSGYITYIYSAPKIGKAQPNSTVIPTPLGNTTIGELKVGDIISFRQGQSVITHRINEILEDTYITKGDNNNTTDDEPITYEQIEGKVEKVIPIVGKFALMLHQKIAIIIFIVLVYMYVLYTGTIKRKKANRRIKREKYEMENRHE